MLQVPVKAEGSQSFNYEDDPDYEFVISLPGGSGLTEPPLQVVHGISPQDGGTTSGAGGGATNQQGGGRGIGNQNRGGGTQTPGTTRGGGSSQTRRGTG